MTTTGTARGCLLSLAAGALLIVLFPSPNLAYLAPVSLVPLLLGLAAEPRPQQRFLLGCIAGSAFWGGTCYWIYDVLAAHGHIPWPGAALMFAAFCLVKGLHLGVFGWLAGRQLNGPWAVPVVAATWVAVEGTHQYAGFTWLMLGNAGTDIPAVVRLAPWTGVWGASFVLALMNVALALALLRRPRRHLAWILLPLLLFLLPKLPDVTTGKRTARLVQTDLSAEEIYSREWTPERADQLLRQLGALSTTTGGRPDLIVWPENPAPFYFYNDPVFHSFMQNLARQQGAPLLFGTVAFRDPAAREPLNSAVLLGPDGNEIARYDKIHLVPFGEFVPWPFSSIVEKITREAGDFKPGDRVVVAQIGERRIGTFICYESVFGRGVRKFVAGGAELLVNVSNDGWFGQSAARRQHLLIARMRAIENARWLLRATNTGMTAAIDPAGRVTATLPIDRWGALDARFDYAVAITIYTKWGDWFWWLMVVMALAAEIVSRTRRAVPLL